MSKAVDQARKAPSAPGIGKTAFSDKTESCQTGPGPDEDREIIRRIKEGETELFSRLVTKYEGRIYSVVARIVASREDAEEVANDAFVSAYVKINSFREEARFYSWLYRIATNHALNRVKYNKRRGEGRKQSLETMVEKAGDAAMARLGASTNTPRSGAQNREWQDLIEAALEGLTPAYRTVIVLRDVEGLAYDEIASLTRLPLGTVKSRLHKGRAMLQRILGQYR